MVLHDPATDPYSDLDAAVGIGVCQTDEDQLHIGILYRIDDGEVRICHFAFHHLLRDEEAAQAELPKLLWADCGIDPILQRSIAPWIANLHENAENIPFGMDYTGSALDPVTGEFYPPPIGKGLTCATFVLMAFRAQAIELLDEATWHVREEDGKWLCKVVRRLIRYCKARSLPYKEHARAMLRDKGAKRFRPDEVAAAAISDQSPLAFPDARRIADQIIADVATAT